MKRRCLAFDIETAKVVSFDGADWRRYRPLGICCAATLLEGEDMPMIWHGGKSRTRPTRQMKQRELSKLLEYLTRKSESGFTILTWNGVGFDFDVLAEGNVPGVVENAVGGLAVEPTSSAVNEPKNQTHQTHEETRPQSAGGSQHQIV